MELKPKIDFIGIGAQKGGTTWLYSNLSSLPDFFLPPMKELHYFDRNPKYLSTNKLYEGSLRVRLRKIKWLKGALSTMLSEIRRGNFSNMKWFFRWYFSNFSDNWYLSLFDSSEVKLRGEITPSYSILQKEDIQKMHDLAPKAKIIFILRNPVDRAWSNYRYNTEGRKKERGSTPIDAKKVIKFMNSKAQEVRSDYTSALNNYSDVFSHDQILICFYDAIRDNPLKLLENVVAFIGGDPQNIINYCDWEDKVNYTKPQDCPQEVFDHLKKKYRNQIKSLSDTYGGYCSNWYTSLYLSNSQSLNDVTASLKGDLLNHAPTMCLKK